MLARRHVSILTIAGLLTLVLTQFQNCAPSTPMQTDSSSGQVKIVDEYNKSDVQFVSEDVQARDDVAAVDVDGLCSREHNGQRLHWRLSGDDPSAQPLIEGSATCKSGQFQVNVEDLEHLDCGNSHLVVVESDWGASGYTRLTRRCQPLVSQEVVAPEQSPYGTSCSLEYNAGVGSAQACQKVCYRDGKMVTSQAVDVGQCQPMVAKLAGP